MISPPFRTPPDPALSRPANAPLGTGQPRQRTSSESLDVGRTVPGGSKSLETVATGPVTAGTSPILLYDGLCGFCNTSVQFILGHETRHSLRFAALQGKFAAEVRQRHPQLHEVDSLVWVEGEGANERVTVRSAAALKAVNYLGGLWRLYLVFGLVPVPVRDGLYNLFARHRHRFFGRYGSCPVPTADVRGRFLA